MKELIKTINEQISLFHVNAEKHLNGNKSAGTRARKATLELTKLFKEYRQKSMESSK